METTEFGGECTIGHDHAKGADRTANPVLEGHECAATGLRLCIGLRVPLKHRVALLRTIFGATERQPSNRATLSVVVEGFEHGGAAS